MRKRRVVVCGVLALFCLGTLWTVPGWRSALVGFCRKESTYQGRYTNSWRNELQGWEQGSIAFVPGIPTGCKVHGIIVSSWHRRPPLWRKWLSKATGLGPGNTPSVHSPLLNGDPAALAVLVELLKDRDPQVRGLAAEGLGKIGPAALPAFSALLEARHDEDWWVRHQAEDALYRIDPEAAAGTEAE
jgi:hypothetical protein